MPIKQVADVRWIHPLHILYDINGILRLLGVERRRQRQMQHDAGHQRIFRQPMQLSMQFFLPGVTGQFQKTIFNSYLTAGFSLIFGINQRRFRSAHQDGREVYLFTLLSQQFDAGPDALTYFSRVSFSVDESCRRYIHYLNLRSSQLRWRL